MNEKIGRSFTQRVVKLQNAFLDIKEHDMLLMSKEQRHKFRKVLKAIYAFAKDMEKHPFKFETRSDGDH